MGLFQKSLTGVKILFVQGFYVSLERLEGKIGEAPFFKVQSGKITVCQGLKTENKFDEITFFMRTTLKSGINITP